MSKLTTKDIIKSDYLTITDLKTIPKLIKEWFCLDSGYTLTRLITEQTQIFANSCVGRYSSEVVKIEKLEWVKNDAGRHNDYKSDITVWVTAIVDLGFNRIVRLSFDLFDSLIMTFDKGCSGSIHEIY